MGLLTPDEKKKRKTQAFRPRADHEEFLERMKVSRGVGYTRTITAALDLLIEADRRLGQDLRMMEAIAESRGLKLGEVMTEAARRGWPDLFKELSKKPL